MFAIITNDNSISKEVFLCDNLDYGQRERLQSAGYLLICIPKQVYHLEEFCNVIFLASIGAFNDARLLIDWLYTFLLLTCLNFYCRSLISEE